MSTGVLRGGDVRRRLVVPDRARPVVETDARVTFASPANTDGDAGTGGVVSVMVHGSDESWMPDSSTTVGDPDPAQRRYSVRPPPMPT